MSAQLVFSFPPNVTHETVLSVVNAHFLPNRIAAADNPAAGVTTTAQQAFGNPSEAQQAFGALATAPAAPNASALMGNSLPPVNAAMAFAAPGASVVAAPSASATPSNPADSGAAVAQYDKDGRPWDARIDSNPPSLTDKGAWRKKRGASDELIAEVSAELRQAGKYGTPGVGAGHAETFTATKFEGLRNLQAHELAIQQVGKIPFDDETFVRLISGPMGSVTLDANCGDWYLRYNNAYNEARQRLNAMTATAGAPALPAATQPPAIPTLPAAQPLSEHAKFVLWVAGEVAAGRLTEQKVSEVMALCNVKDEKGNGSVQALAGFPDFIPQVKQFLIANYGAQA